MCADAAASGPVQLRRAQELAWALDEFATYVDSNAGAIVNYGPMRGADFHRLRRIPVYQVIAKRFVKKQQMRWTPRGTHMLHHESALRS